MVYFVEGGKKNSIAHHSARYQDDPTFIIFMSIEKNYQVLRYNRLQHNVFTDTIQEGTVSRIGI